MSDEYEIILVEFIVPLPPKTLLLWIWGAYFGHPSNFELLLLNLLKLPKSALNSFILINIFI